MPKAIAPTAKPMRIKLRNM